MYCVNLFAISNHLQVGGKAANLAKASALGLSIPNGFVITRNALTFFLEENALTMPVNGFILQDWEDRSAQQECYIALYSSIMTAPIPESLKCEVEALAAKFFETASIGIAVRSSGVHEDTDAASFAGVFKSLLGIVTLEALWNSIRLCWCSSWTPQAISYAKRKGIVTEPDQMAILVQEIIPAESAGVIFTANPLTGNPWQFVLNAAWGLAQNLVDGVAPADVFVLDSNTGQILEKHIAEKPTALVTDSSGISQVTLTEDKRKAASLSDGMAVRIGQMALQLDIAFNRRLDIEWAVIQDDLYLVQVRPLTALPTFFPHELSDTDAKLAWTLSDPAWFTSINEGEHIVAPLFRDRWGLEQWHRNLVPGDIFPRRVGYERDFNGYRYSTEWEWKTGQNDPEWIEQWLRKNEGQLRNSWLTQKASIRQASRQIAEAQQKARRVQELIHLLLDCRKLEDEMQAAVWAAPQWMFFTCEYLLKGLVQEIAPDFVCEELMQGLPSYSHERTRAAQVLGRSIHEENVREIFVREPPEAIISALLAYYPDSHFLKDYTAFCWEFGICPPTLSKPWSFWSQNPAPILISIKNAILGQGRDVDDVLEECIRARKAQEERLIQQVVQFGTSTLDRLNRILDLTKFWMPVLDDRSWHYVVRTRLADLMRQTGTVLMEDGLLDNPADVLLLTATDLANIAKTSDVHRYRELYLERKSEYERHRRLTPPLFLGTPTIISPTVQTSIAPELDASGKIVFRGHGFSPGLVVGISRKVLTLNDPAFQDTLTSEHILVCPKSKEWRPDWLSLFMVIKGLVTVRGVQLQHATQIARECGIPFINLPEDAWDSIPDNVKLSIDGNTGTVIVLEQKA